MPGFATTWSADVVLEFCDESVGLSVQVDQRSKACPGVQFTHVYPTNEEILLSSMVAGRNVWQPRHVVPVSGPLLILEIGLSPSGCSGCGPDDS
jgi:hypothetical protein